MWNKIFGQDDEERSRQRDMDWEREYMEERKRRHEAEERERKKREKYRREVFGKFDALNSKSKSGIKNMVINNLGGESYKLCEMERLKRFLLLGCEFNKYYCSGEQFAIDNVICVRKLLSRGKHMEVLETLDQFNKQGRAAKYEPLLFALSICALNEKIEVRRAAYDKVNSICNIPTKLFKFLELTHGQIVNNRNASPPTAQPFKSEKRKLKSPETAFQELSIVSDVEKEPIENMDASLEPKKKKKKVKKEKELKKVRTDGKSLGWGRLRRRGFANFYTDPEKDPCRLLYLMTKYKQRHEWSHGQVVKYSHPKMTGEDSAAKNLVLKYCTAGYSKVTAELEEMKRKPGLSDSLSKVIGYIEALNEVKNLKPATDEERLIEILKIYGVRNQRTEFASSYTVEGGSAKSNPGGLKDSIQIVREHLPTGFLNSIKVWEMMLQDMPMTAMIRNLGKMSSLGLFDDNDSPNTQHVLSALRNEKKLQSARVHPVTILIATNTYSKGQGEKGGLTWKVNEQIVKAMDDAFYKSFRSPEIGKSFKTGKKYLLGLDVSGSMTWGGCFGCPVLSPAQGTAAMAMVTWNIEDNVEVMGFGGEFVDLKPILNKQMTVIEAMRAISSVAFGGTDCSLPMVWALNKNIEVDVFIIYTDNETNGSTVEPMEALKIYNEEMNCNAKLIVNAMSVNEFTIADPKNPNALDICGFDANVPEIMNNFITGSGDQKCNICDDCKKERKKEKPEAALS